VPFFGTIPFSKRTRFVGIVDPLVATVEYNETIQVCGCRVSPFGAMTRLGSFAREPYVFVVVLCMNMAAPGEQRFHFFQNRFRKIQKTPIFAATININMRRP
jgi:hypothetical protein